MRVSPSRPGRGVSTRCDKRYVKDENAVLGGMAGGPEGLLLLALVIYDVLTGTGADSAWFGPCV